MSEDVDPALVSALEAMTANNPYYEFIGVEVDTVEPGRLVLRLPYSEAVAAPAVGADGIHGGVLTTLIDSAGMGSAIALKGEPVPLATADMSVNFHSPADEAVLCEAEVISDGSTLVTSRVRLYPEAKRDAADSSLVASGTTTARLFG